jgi:hypothetical protein
LIAEASDRGFDLILDPKLQAMGVPGGPTENLAALPWGLSRHHRQTDFQGSQGRNWAAQIVEMAVNNGFTQLLGPTHLLSGATDPWLHRDIDMMRWAEGEIAGAGIDVGLIYSLALPIEVLRNRLERQTLVAAIADAPSNAIWLKIENFGDDATGEKTAAYIEACRDFHQRGIPVVGDHIGGLPGLGALAFGAVGGIAHGVTVHQNFKASSWRRPRLPGNGGPVRRVYLAQLDMLIKPDIAQALLGCSQRVRARCGCRDTHCCPHGVRDMIGHPARHALYQRAREIDVLSSTPQSLRVARYLDERVRRVSDDVAAIAGLSALPGELQERFAKKQKRVSRFRQAMAHLAEVLPMDSVAATPPPRGTAE